MRPLLPILVLVSATACADRVIEDAVTFDPALDPDPDDEPAPEPDSDDPDDSDDSDDDDAESTGRADTWPAPRVIFLNFDGVTLIPGPDDSRANTATIASEESEFAAYGYPETISEITALLRDTWSPTNVVFTTDRPGGGDYTMVVITPTNPYEPDHHGIAVVGCDDTRRNSVVAAFSHGPDGPRTPQVVASSISRELGFSFGLDPVKNPDDVMAEGVVPGHAFVDTCSPVGENSVCGDTDFCPAGSRNSMAQLMDLTYAR